MEALWAHLGPSRTQIGPFRMKGKQETTDLVETKKGLRAQESERCAGRDTVPDQISAKIFNIMTHATHNFKTLQIESTTLRNQQSNAINRFPGDTDDPII